MSSVRSTAAAFQDSLANETHPDRKGSTGGVHRVGVLYESFIDPITILSTIPSAGVGVLLALKVKHHELDVIGLIEIILFTLTTLIRTERD